MRETFFEVVAHAAPVALAVMCRDGVVEYANPATSAITGLEVVPGTVLGDAMVASDAERFRGFLRSLDASVVRHRHLAVRLRQPEGRLRELAVLGIAFPGSAERVVVALQDPEEIGNVRVPADAVDALTGLLVRQSLFDHLESFVDSEEPAVLAMIDLDNFKTVNDSVGHAAGDVVLAVTAERLRAQVDEADLVARLGGDEFVVVWRQCARSEVQGRMKALLSDIAAPISMSDRLSPIVVTATAGVVLAEHASDAENWLVLADVAMYEAKKTGRASWRLGGPSQERRTSVRSTRQGDLQQLREYAFFSAKTGLPNDRALDADLNDLDNVARILDEPYALLFADVDRFRRFNKTVGWDAANQALREIGDAIRGAIREQDAVFHISGEEFNVVLPNTTRKQAKQVAQRIRTAVSGVFPSGQRVTLSIGCAVLDTERDRTYKHLRRRAERALKKAKRKGRDQVRFAK